MDFYIVFVPAAAAEKIGFLFDIRGKVYGDSETGNKTSGRNGRVRQFDNIVMSRERKCNCFSNPYRCTNGNVNILKRGEADIEVPSPDNILGFQKRKTGAEDRRKRGGISGISVYRGKPLAHPLHGETPDKIFHKTYISGKMQKSQVK